MIKKTIWVLPLLISFLYGYSQQLAFPGAEGYGKYASGGRGNGQTGKIAIVTNLEDDTENPPAGSLRWALQQGNEIMHDPIIGDYTIQRPLTIVFRVGGVIKLKGDIKVKRDNLTIAGQTAPGGGICIRGATVNLNGSFNVIIRHIRFRPGDEKNAETSALRIENGGNFIIDHCSTSWGIEETTHFSSNDNTTVQWCILSESLYNSIHKKGARGYAAQWGGEYASYHHNLLAHNRSRSPRINGSNENDIEALVDYRNNVNYNWGSSGAFYGGEWEGTPNCTGFSHVNVVNNYFIPGPATEGTTIAAPTTNRGGVTLCGYAQWYVDGNIMVGREDKTANNWLGIDYSNIEYIKTDVEHVKTDGMLEDYDNYTQSAEDAYAAVMENVGAVLPKRDAIDERIIKEVKGELGIIRYAHEVNGLQTPVKGVDSGIIDTQQNLVSPEDHAAGKTAWDVYESTPESEAPLDNDNDGMPDQWETEHGLNPTDSLDFRVIAGNGFSNLENFLNSDDFVSVQKSIDNGDYFEVYPNPCKNRIQFRSSKGIAEIQLYDFSGKAMVTLTEEEIHTKYSTQNLQAGIYFAKVIFENNQTAFRKIIILR